MKDLLDAKLTGLARCERGTIAIIAAVALPALLFVTGVAVDFGMMSRQRSILQTIADGAVVAATRELAISSSNAGQIRAVADTYVSAEGKRADGGFQAPVVVDALVDSQAGTVTAVVEQQWQPFFAHLLDASVTPIVVRATAQIMTAEDVCILGLAKDAPRTVFVDHSARITGNDCGVYSNSKDTDAIRADDSGAISASLICAVGGVSGSGSAFSPQPTTDCPPVYDPMVARPEPTVGGCDHSGMEIEDEDKTLYPGVYCGGLEINGNSKVTFSEGIYIISGGMFHVHGKAEVSGTHVAFYLADAAATFEFNADTTVSLTAPKDGPMAGILFFDTRSATVGRKHVINSNNAHTLVGTFYLPKSTLLVDSQSPVASSSAFTAIVAYTLELQEKPHLVLNTDYDLTDVPVPTGLLAGRVMLTN